MKDVFFPFVMGILISACIRHMLTAFSIGATGSGLMLLLLVIVLGYAFFMAVQSSM